MKRILALVVVVTGCVHYGNFTKPDMSQYDADRSQCYQWAEEKATLDVVAYNNTWMGMEKGKLFNNCMVAKGYSKS